MAVAAPMVSPVSPAIKRSSRKRQRPSFFADEIKVSKPAAAPRRHSIRPVRSRANPNQTQPSKRAPRSDLSELHDTVAGLRAQIESATLQMQELKGLVSQLADLYGGTDYFSEEEEEEELFTMPLSPVNEYDD